MAEEPPSLWCPDDERQPQWKKEREEYGFDEREMRKNDENKRI